MNVRRLGTKTQGHTLDTPTANLQPPFFVSSSLSGLNIQKRYPKVPDGLICMFMIMSNASSYGECTPPHIFGTACETGETHLQAHPAKAVATHGHTAQKGSEKGAEVWEIRCHGLRPDAEPLSGERHRPRFSSGSGRTMRAFTKACLPQRLLLMAHLPGDDWREDSRERVPAMAPQLASCHQDPASMEWQQPQDASAHPEGIHLEAIREGSAHFQPVSPRKSKKASRTLGKMGRPRGGHLPSHPSCPHGRQARPSPAITPLSSAPCLEGPAPAWVTGGGGRRRYLEFPELGRIAFVACLGIPVPALIASGTCLEIPVRVCIASGTCLEIPVRVWLSGGPTHPSTEKVKHSASKSVQAPTRLSILSRKRHEC